MDKLICKCGDANPNGNVKLVFKGGCDKDILLSEAYRCTGCNGWFHKDCIFEHFKMEKKHDWGRIEERKQCKKEFLELINNQGDCEDHTLAELYQKVKKL